VERRPSGQHPGSPELRPQHKPKVHLQGIEELVTDKGYHSGAVVKRVTSYEVRSARRLRQGSARSCVRPPGSYRRAGSKRRHIMSRLDL